MSGVLKLQLSGIKKTYNLIEYEKEYVNFELVFTENKFFLTDSIIMILFVYDRAYYFATSNYSCAHTMTNCEDT